MPSIWGYARSSTKEQDLSPICQSDRIRERAAQIPEKGKMADVELENESANKVPYNKREGFARLMKKMQPGDTLIVWRMDRIDRHPFRMINAVQFLMNRQIGLICLKESSGELDLTNTQGKAFVMMMAICNMYWSEYHSEATRTAMRWCKSMGYHVGGVAGYGKKVIDAPDQRRTDGKVRRRQIYDEGECRIIAEIVIRRRMGESIESIARDFNRRNLRRAHKNAEYPDGIPWAPRKGKYKDNPRIHDCMKPVHSMNVLKAYHWAVKELENTGAIGVVKLDEIVLEGRAIAS